MKRLARQRTFSANARTHSAAAAFPANCEIVSAAMWTQCELYLVEGDSAGGSAEGGRLREYQAILPLRGKIINAYKSREDKVLANEEVQSMIQAIGSGIGDGTGSWTPSLRQSHHHDRRRCGRFAHPHAAACASSTGRCIDLVSRGHVYVAQPPLFRVKSKKDDVLRPDRRGNEDPVVGKGTGGRDLRVGGWTANPGRRDGASSVARWHPWRKHCWPWNAAESICERTPSEWTWKRASCPCSTSSMVATNTGLPAGPELDEFLQQQEEATGGELAVKEAKETRQPRNRRRKTARTRDRTCTSPSCMKCGRSTPA